MVDRSRVVNPIPQSPVQGGSPAPGPGSPYPGGSATLGQPMYPWLMRYQGPTVAPMTDIQNATLSHMYNLYGGGGGSSLGKDVFGQGQVQPFQFQEPVNPTVDNQWTEQTKKAAQTLKDYQDQQALARIGSSAAAGGNALSGARMQAEGDYLRTSGASFDEMIANMMNDNMNRALDRYQQQWNAAAAAQGNYASGLLRQQMQNQELNQRGLGMLWNAAGLPQQLGTQELGNQYNDYLRQIQGMYNAYQQPNQMALNTLQQGRYGGQYYPQYGNSQASGYAALVSSLLPLLIGGGGGGGGGYGGGGGLLGAISSILGGGGGGGQGGYYNPYGDMSGYTGSQAYDQPIGPNMYDPYSQYSMYDPYGGMSDQAYQDYLNNYYNTGGT